jgi:hypothetical protein
MNTPPSTLPRRAAIGAGIAVLLAALSAGYWAGLLRMGTALPFPPGLWLALHGPLMAAGVFGTIVSLERAVALRLSWAYAAPALGALGTVFILASAPAEWSTLTLFAAGCATVVVNLKMARLHPALHTATLVAGALSLALGSLLRLAGQPISHSAVWWMAFLVLTIAGERLELSRVRRLTRTSAIAFACCAGTLILGAALVTLDAPGGGIGVGAGLLSLALWLAIHDVARTNAKRTGLIRYIAICLLIAHAWLAVSGALWLALGDARGGPVYDALLHTIFVGFTLSMIFGHAPIILPSVAGIAFPYSDRLYAPLGVLHFSVILRIVGDLAGITAFRQAGGWLNGLALLLYLGLLLAGKIAERRRARSN